MASSPTAFLPLFQPVEQRLYQKARGYVLHMERLSARASENVETIDESELLFEKNLKVEKIYLAMKYSLFDRISKEIHQLKLALGLEDRRN